MRKSFRAFVGFWLGFLVLALNQLMDITLVTVYDRLESVSFAITEAAGSVLLPLGCYAAIGAALRLRSFAARSRHAPFARQRMASITAVRQG